MSEILWEPTAEEQELASECDVIRYNIYHDYENLGEGDGVTLGESTDGGNRSMDVGEACLNPPLKRHRYSLSGRFVVCFCLYFCERSCRHEATSQANIRYMSLSIILQNAPIKRCSTVVTDPPYLYITVKGHVVPLYERVIDNGYRRRPFLQSSY